MENPILSAAFVIAATAFFKERLNLSGRAALLCAFLVTLVVALLPLAAAIAPAAASPFLTTLAAVIALFIGSAGSYDTVTNFIRYARTQPPPKTSIIEQKPK